MRWRTRSIVKVMSKGEGNELSLPRGAAVADDEKRGKLKNLTGLREWSRWEGRKTGNPRGRARPQRHRKGPGANKCRNQALLKDLKERNTGVPWAN